MALRTYGRINQTNGVGGTWVQVNTDANGFNDAVYLTTLIQCLKLNQGESPFYATYGIPARQAVLSQVFPDFAAAQTQTQFSPYFAALSISRVIGSFPPVYDVTVVDHTGAIVGVQVVAGQYQVPS